MSNPKCCFGVVIAALALGRVVAAGRVEGFCAGAAAVTKRRNSSRRGLFTAGRIASLQSRG
jgi:hypothetical protein